MNPMNKKKYKLVIFKLVNESIYKPTNSSINLAI